ncbi:MAG: hypothetical protein HQ582_14865 [Planctomycetes bacterium]|nr:hypothetical protein [Planctomycetota bacterium]
MVKRTTKNGTKKPCKRGKANPFPLIEKALGKRTKAELIEMIVKMAKEHATFSRELEDQLCIERPADSLVANVSSAIDRATDFDERQMNYNFDVDWQAYADARKGLWKLIDLGHLEDAKLLALKLMKDGSYQVECSDEGLMTDDIEDCLRLVIRAVRTSGDADADKWANEMQETDRVGFICQHELAELRTKP